MNAIISDRNRGGGAAIYAFRAVSSIVQYSGTQCNPPFLTTKNDHGFLRISKHKTITPVMSI